MTIATRSALMVLSLLGIPAGCGPSPSGQTADANTPGWTGRTVVVGSTSTVAGDAAATEMQQKWQLGRDH